MSSRIVFSMTGAEGVCGGIATANKNNLRGLVTVALDGQMELTVLSVYEGVEDRPDYLPDNVCFRAFRGNKLMFGLALTWSAARGGCFIFDHVHLTLPVLPWVVVRRCRLVVLAHGSEADDRMKTTSRWAFSLARHVLTNSRLTLGRLQRHLPDVRGEACLLGLSPDIPLGRCLAWVEEQKLEMASSDGIVRRLSNYMLLLVARLDAGEGEKGHDAIIRALVVLRERFPDVQAVFPGPGSGREALQRMAKELSVDDRVFFPGYVSTEMLEQLYRRCYAFVMPSQQEGFGLVYLEAMNYGKVCVGCRNDGAEEVIVHGHTGLLLRNQLDTKELLAALDCLLSDRDWARDLGKNGFERLHSLFTATRHQARFVSALKSLV